MKITGGIKTLKVWHSYNLKQSKATKYTSRQERQMLCTSLKNVKQSQFLPDVRAPNSKKNFCQVLDLLRHLENLWKTQWCRTRELWVLLLALQSTEQGEDGGLQQPRDLLGRYYRAITVPCYREKVFLPSRQVTGSFPFKQRGVNWLKTQDCRQLGWKIIGKYYL